MDTYQVRISVEARQSRDPDDLVDGLTARLPEGWDLRLQVDGRVVTLAAAVEAFAPVVAIDLAGEALLLATRDVGLDVDVVAVAASRITGADSRSVV